MAYPSQPDLLVLHAVRILGMADATAVARRFQLDPDVSEELLLDFEANGWIQRVQFADISGWALTDAGRAEDERRLGAELDQCGARSTVVTAYADSDQLRTTPWHATTTATAAGTRGCSTPSELSIAVFVPYVLTC